MKGKKISKISGGLTHSAFITDAGELFTVGKGNHFISVQVLIDVGKFGRLGSGDERDFRYPSLVNIFTTYQQRIIDVGK